MLVTSSEEVRELVEPLSSAANPAVAAAGDDRGGRGETSPEQGRLQITDALSEEQARVYSALPQRRGAEAAALAARTGLDTASAMAALAALELAGLAERRDHGWVKLRHP